MDLLFRSMSKKKKMILGAIGGIIVWLVLRQIG